MNPCNESPAPAPQHGFTLVEVMVSLAVLSLILLSTVTALRTFANTQQTLDRTVGRIDEVRTVSSFLRDQFEAAVLGFSSEGLTLGGSADEGAYFSGDVQSLVWKANVRFGESYGGKHLLRVARQGDDLFLQWQDVPSTTRDLEWAGAASRRLVAGVEEFSLAYRVEHGGDWVGTLDQGVTPALVRMRIRARGRFWPDLVMVVPR